MNITTALEYHLAHNHYPPVPLSMVPVCAAAIALAADGDWDGVVALPDGVTYRGADAAPAHAVVEQHHLEAFVADAAAEWVVVNDDDPHLYWSNEDGWGDLASATVFASGERDTVRLPLDGSWLPY